ncbi:SMI1/KNR4 family protein [Streptomyces sp. NPDC059637]|uniref:SMI1/KNR4 family protein n=1 Tax=Streptomyces sp. NPDC059637 TaxID=3347752 RepID=UPI0036D204AA
MTDFDDLVGRVVTRARTDSGELPAPVGAEEIAAAEAALGLTLPPLLARLYGEVGNGGFGPDYRLFPLAGAGRTAVGLYHLELAGCADSTRPHWPAGVLPILDWGCGMYAAVDCTDDAGPVLLFEPNPVDSDDNWKDAWFLDSGSLAEWLEKWLSGTGWFEEDSYEKGDPEEPQPWPPAAARLTAAQPAAARPAGARG